MAEKVSSGMPHWSRIESGTTDDLLAVQVWSADQAMAVGKRGICLRLDGDEWRRETTGLDEDLYSVWGPSPGEVFAVGGNLHVGGQSKVCHLHDGQWTVHQSGIQSLLLCVFGDRAGVVRAVGFNGGIVEQTSEAWREIDAGTNEHLFCLRALGGQRWLALGLNGTLLENDGSAWCPVEVTRAHLTCAWELGKGVVAVGYNGTVIWRRTDDWELEPPQTREHLFGVWGPKSGRAFACGARGTIVAYDGADWTVEATGFHGALHGISGVGDFVIAVGSGGAIFQRMAGRMD